MQLEAIGLTCLQKFFQITEKYIILMLLHVSTMNRSLLQGHTVFQDKFSVPCYLSAVNSELCTGCIITQLTL
jgi:hypothetical protein